MPPELQPDFYHYNNLSLAKILITLKNPRFHCSCVIYKEVISCKGVPLIISSTLCNKKILQAMRMKKTIFIHQICSYVKENGMSVELHLFKFHILMTKASVYGEKHERILNNLLVFSFHPQITKHYTK